MDSFGEFTHVGSDRHLLNPEGSALGGPPEGVDELVYRRLFDPNSGPSGEFHLLCREGNPSEVLSLAKGDNTRTRSAGEPESVDRFQFGPLTSKGDEEGGRSQRPCSTPMPRALHAS